MDRLHSVLQCVAFRFLDFALRIEPQAKRLKLLLSYGVLWRWWGLYTKPIGIDPPLNTYAPNNTTGTDSPCRV